MAQFNCDICGVRPATVRIAVLQDGMRRNLDVCDYHYAQLTRHQRTLSPLEALFRGAQQQEDAAPQGMQQAMETGDSAVVERYLSDVARELLQRAAERAMQFGRREVDTEHLLYEIAGNEAGVAMLKRLGIEPDDVRAYIDANAQKREPPQAVDEGRMAVSPRLKSAIDRAFLVSRELGHSYVAPEHLVFGLSQVQDSFASHLLGRYGVTPQKVLQRLVEAEGDKRERAAAKGVSATPQLDQYSRDLTALAGEGKLDPVIGRSSEIETVVEVLARRRKNNPVLIGEPGVGKTAIAEGLAQRMLNGDVPESLRGRRLVELNVNGLIAGAKYRGEFEERVKQVMEEISAQRDTLVLFIDEVHMIVGAGQGGGEGGLDIANVFKPAMARGELNLIGATTLAEYQKYIEKDAALERRFQPVFVSEPSVDQTINILRGLRDKLEVHHRVTIRDDALVAAAELSDRYVTGRFLPDKAIDLIDQAAARVHLSATSRPAAILELEAELAQLRREQDYAATRKNFERAHALDEPVANKEKALSEATSEWKSRLGSVTSDVTTEHIAEIVSKLTGVPVTQLTAEERTRLLEMEKRLHERVIGQEKAIVAVSDAVRRSRAGLRRGRRPTAVFLFLGPTGVGKTELAKALAEVVFGDEDAIVRIDMSEYMERHAVSRLIGSPPGYVGYDEGGQLTERVRRRPYCVILLDEIEKAHSDVYNVLLQVFDDGRLTDGKGRVVDFSNTVVIATSNLGSDVVSGQKRSGPGFLSNGEASTQNAVLTELRQHFRPEFLNRIDEIIVFQPLTDGEMRSIVHLLLNQVQRMAHSQDIELTFDDSVVDHLAAVGYRPEFGARELRRQIQQMVENELAKAMLKGDVKEGAKIVCRFDASQQRLEFVGSGGEAH
ncbi:ATP-dependent Clp protease ATP-binding subunit [Paraburkholderia dinghuensis]|uniref:ATP-dependent Clp protease ATP-binding subunit n=1 Tax=Paraburkholderia dinghuensis TaxID=2305225 RepID=A0A3N6PMG1_9BURK|nr:ATP-dependent Clp protease ATP-binding subunit [Paraburkholderia dinghuensis]RQH02790.1 ATP-dependent Clp protease ATP-binding subunit [Paraburkholderia dinghuensis]